MFVALAEELADLFVSAAIDAVAGDAVEGFNPSHDVCRFVIDGAVVLAERRTGRPLGNHDFVLDSRPMPAPRGAATPPPGCVSTTPRSIARSTRPCSTRSCGRKCTPRWSASAAAPSPSSACGRSPRRRCSTAFDGELPAYERYGEDRVRAGRYTEIIRYRQHVLPVRAAIEAAVHGRLADAVPVVVAHSLP